jgi:molybdate transport system substrate-binding protein
LNTIEKENSMKLTLAAVLLLGASIAAAQAAEIKVFVPPVINAGGAADLAKAFTAKTGVKVTVTNHSMGRIMNDIQNGPDAPDVVFLPVDYMGTLALAHGIKGSFAPVGRVSIGLAVLKGQPIPDISTVDKLAAVLKASKGITYSDPTPARGSVEAGMIDQLLHRPEIIGAKGIYAPTGPDGKLGPNGPAWLIAGHGDMTLQLLDEVAQPELVVVGPVPPELHAFMDNAAAVSTRAADAADAEAFIKFVLSPEAKAIWHKGVELY